MATKGNGKHNPHRLGGDRTTTRYGDEGGVCRRGGKSDGARGKPPAGNRQGDLLCDRNNRRGGR